LADQAATRAANDSAAAAQNVAVDYSIAVIDIEPDDVRWLRIPLQSLVPEPLRLVSLPLLI